MRKIGSLPVGSILSYVDTMVKKFVQLPSNPKPENKSGYFTIRRKKDGRILLIAQIGECPDIIKAEKYRKFSIEKGQRLHNWNKHQGHLSSWQSRNEEKKRYAGAIVAYDFILSFSGLPELGDEAVMMLLAFFLNWANYNDIVTITKISNNPFLDKLYNAVFHSK